MYLRRNSRFRYVLHTLIHDPKPITTNPMTMYLRWRRSWYDLGRSRYAHADQLTFWVRSIRRYLSRPYRYMRRPLPISSSCPSVLRIQYTVLCFWFKFWNSMSFSSNKLSWHYYSNGEASSAELIALSTKAIEQIIIRINKKKDRIVSRPVWNILSRIDRIKREWMDGIDFLNDATLILMRGLRPCQNPKLIFNEPFWVASPAHPHCLSGNNLNLVLYGSGEAGVQRRLIGGRSALVRVGS